MQTPHHIAGIGPNDTERVLALNNAFATEMSWLDQDRLQRLVATASYARRVGALDGFMIAFAGCDTFDGLNFQWFKARYGRFLYVDRIAVAPLARGRGVARALYGDVFAFARATGIERVTCEVNIAPPNPASDALHHALGFREVGTAASTGGKVVRYLELLLS